MAELKRCENCDYRLETVRYAKDFTDEELENICYIGNGKERFYKCSYKGVWKVRCDICAHWVSRKTTIQLEMF